MIDKRVEFLLRELYLIWHDPGVEPEHHRRIRREFESRWPALAAPIKELVGLVESKELRGVVQRKKKRRRISE